MDYKAEYQRLTGRQWPYAWEPFSGSYDEMKAWLLALFGPHEIRTLPNGSTQYIWRAPTREEIRALQAAADFRAVMTGLMTAEGESADTLQRVSDGILHLAEPHDGEEASDGK